jgi:CBS domain containing-hemolysin-like protein
VLGKSEIDEVNEIIPMSIPDSREYDTFSGYILEQIGRIPREKEEIPLGDYMVTVNEMDGIRIKEYIVKKQADLPLISPP